MPLLSFFFTKKNSAWENYEAIGGKSPINELTQQLIDKLQKALPNTFVTQAMRYTPPFAAKCCELIKQKGIKEVTLLPLYPQYSTTTTKSSVEDLLILHRTVLLLKLLNLFIKMKNIIKL